MKNILIIFIGSFFILGCSKTAVEPPKKVLEFLPQTSLLQASYEELPNWENENYAEVLENFKNSCKTSKVRNIYGNLCQRALDVNSSKNFLEEQFVPFKIILEDADDGLLTGYYEPELRGSLEKTDLYKYPIRMTPKDLVVVDLGSIYPELKHYRLRGRLEGNKLLPYDTREQSRAVEDEVICYTDSLIDLFFLEVQGSGRITLESGEVLFIGYDNQNGHKYRSIGKYLIEIGVIKKEEISLQSIRAWLEENPHRVNEVLNHNESVVYFKQKEQSATGSLGIPLTPWRSVAVDRKYIPLGSMLYLQADVDAKKVAQVMLAQDTGGAIKGSVRADLFLGYGNEAMRVAGQLQSPLKLWILLPKDMLEEE